MPEYIDKELLLKEATAEGAYGYVDVRQINEMPTIDIVHCNECKHRREYEEYDRAIDEFIDCSYCKRDGKYHDEDWFCAGGDSTIQGYTDGVFWERNTNAIQQKFRK